MLCLANHVFGHHDSRIDEHADGDGDSAQRHDVRRDARAFHEQERAQHRERQRNGDDENAAEVPEEEHVRQRDQNDLFNQRVAQRVHRMIDENAAVIEGNDRYARRKPRLNLADLLLDGFDDLARIGSVADDDDSADGFLAVLVENAAPELGTKLNAGHVADRDRRAVVGAERNLFNVLQAANQADAAHDVLRVARLNHLGADVVVAALHRGDHILERDVVGAHLDGIEIDLVLLDEAADAGNLGDSGHGVELIFDEPILNRVQRAAVIRTLDGVPEDLANSGCIRTHHRRNARGQKAAGKA